MRLTNFRGLASNGIPVLGALPIPSTQGNVFHVKPYSGSDGNTGVSPSQALKTLAGALAKCTAGQNDIVLFYAESNTAANTTDYQSATLDWNKDLVHLIGVSSGNGIASRARVAFTSTYDTASNLFTLSANGCIISNIHFFAGVAGTNPVGCFKVTGQRNTISNCHIAGIGNNANDIAGAYSVRLSGAAENMFTDCVIGLDTIARGSAVNADILLDTQATRNIFKNCLMLGYAEHASNWSFLTIGAAALDRFIIFDNCVFHNATKSGATGLTQAFQVNAAASGSVILKGCSVIGATDWVQADTGLVFTDTPAPSASAGGLQVAATR